MLDREAVGRIVRATWIAWAQEQANPKPSWLLPWEELSEEMREVDCRIGDAVCAAILAEEREIDRQFVERERGAGW
jgi:hypothetical protein